MRAIVIEGNSLRLREVPDPSLGPADLLVRIRATSVFIFDSGISTRRCFAPHALRMRVNMSAIGSLMLMCYVPCLPYP